MCVYACRKWWAEWHLKFVYFEGKHHFSNVNIHPETGRD